MITAVLAVKDRLDLTKIFLPAFLRKFPTVPVVVSCLGSKEDTTQYLKELERIHKNVKVVSGTREGTISFSENFNAAINAVSTEKLVVIHNDMEFAPDFFEVLDRELEDPQEFQLYTTVEVSQGPGHTRPGKVTIPEPFSGVEEFLHYAEEFKHRNVENVRQPAYGFFLAGFTESFHNIGGYDQETFVPYFCEDDDFMVRLRIKGYRVVWNKQAVVFHMGGQTSRSSEDSPKIDVKSNRNFVRKWGFEPRFLWTTGYESTEVFKVRNILIAYADSDINTIFNVEPLFQELVVDDRARDIAEKVMPSVESHDLPIVSISSKIVQRPESLRSSILITRIGQFDFDLLCNLVGKFRVQCDSGIQDPIWRIYREGPYLIQCFRSLGFKEIIDSKNYLSLQKSIQYNG